MHLEHGAAGENGAGSRTGEKFRALKAREAAKKARQVAGKAADAVGGVAGTAVVGAVQEATKNVGKVCSGGLPDAYRQQPQIWWKTCAQTEQICCADEVILL